ncbi:larval-specific very high density lipoprotein [Xylocopa sonorina]|uniref:larval-specific very high density lipoprotein n=1 Tax=Xylocopa sonorina TaxID=1818115 RepID=UPI00403B10B0
MNALIVFLGTLATTLAISVAKIILLNTITAYVPHGKTVTYKYTADVKAGVIEPASLASQYGIECLLHVKHDATDPTLKNAYYVTLTDVKHGMHNGHTTYHEHVHLVHPIVEAAEAIETPFLVVYDESGNLQGVKLTENEPGWSRNIKKAIASMLHLNLSNIPVQTSTKSHTFSTHEDTIHGICKVEYQVHSVNRTSTTDFVVTKIYEPKYCSHFNYYEFHQFECEKCHTGKQDDMTTTSKRVFEIEQQGNDLLIKKLISYGVINYLPWSANSEAHYLLTNQTLVLQNVVPVSNIQLPVVNFQNNPVLNKVFYDKPQTQYTSQAEVDITYGRHVVKLDELTVKLKQMLEEAANYLKDHHGQPDWKHGQTINRLLRTMSYMNVETLKRVYNELKFTQDSKQEMMKNIFLLVVPNVGTTAACIFTRNLIQTGSIPNWIAVTMLTNLPMHVKDPSEELLLQMEKLLYLGSTVSARVKDAGIFCFATLVHKTFKDKYTGAANNLLDKYLQHFMDHIKNEPTHHMKTVYMMAMKNVKLSHILTHLEPIIRGETVISQKPHTIRTQAIWAIKSMHVTGTHRIYVLLWPILSDVTLPTATRIAAYDALVHHLPDPRDLVNIHWFMTTEKNDHLYNYHVDTIKGLANSVDSCMLPLQEVAKEILSFITTRHATVPLSGKVYVDYVDEKYGYGEAVKGSYVVHHLTGLPYVGSVEHITSVSHKRITGVGIHWNIEGLHEIMKNVKHKVFNQSVQAIKNTNVKNVLTKAARDMPVLEDVDVNVILTINDYVVSMYHYNKDNWMHALDEMAQWKEFFTENMNDINWQSYYSSVAYRNHFEMHMPTDLGVPAILSAKVPSFDSLVGTVSFSEDKNLSDYTVQVKYHSWTHAEPAMSVYNPIVDVWHVIRRPSVQDIVLPIKMHVRYNSETKNIKVTLARLPVSEYSVAEMSTYVKSYVSIFGDETDHLKKSCDTCHHHEMVTGVVNPKKYENVVESKDTGLKFTTSVYNCESTVTPVPPMVEWMKTLTDGHKNTMGYTWVHVIMGIRQQMINDVISGHEKSCATTIKVEPSIVHPTSVIEIVGKVNVQNMDHTSETMSLLSSTRFDVRGTLTAKAASTYEVVRQWDVNVNALLSQGHVNNNVKVMATRTTIGEKNLKICVTARKDYSADTSDLFKVGTGKKEVNSKVTITMGETTEDKCVNDQMDVTITMKGELTDEQKEHTVEDSVHSTCATQTQNSLYHSGGLHVPHTWHCMQEAVLHSTMRKFTVNMALRKVPLQLVSCANILQDVVRSLSHPHVTYSWDHVETGNVKAVVEFPYHTNVLNTEITTPTYTYDLVELPFGDPLWNVWMDNTHYDVTKLYNYVNKRTMPCSIYPRVLLTLDNGTMPFIVPDKWTLMTGDHIDQTYSVFVKSVQTDKLAMKVIVGEHELEVKPLDSEVTVIVNNKVIPDYKKGIMVPEGDQNSYAIKVTKAYEHLVVESTMVPVHIYYVPHTVTVDLKTELQGQVTGLCGCMDGTHKVEIPKIYTVSHV